MPSTLFLEAFGQLSRDTSLAGIVSEDEDLYSVFNERAELMSWATTASQRRRVELWAMNEAELTAGTDASRIGWVQVGLGEVVQRYKPGRLVTIKSRTWVTLLWKRECISLRRKVLPWKSASPETEQIRFIQRWERGGETFLELCRGFGISRKTGYKRVQRFPAMCELLRSPLTR